MRKWQTTPVFLPEKSHGQRSLERYSPWGPKESDMTSGYAEQVGRGKKKKLVPSILYLSSIRKAVYYVCH